MTKTSPFGRTVPKAPERARVSQDVVKEAARVLRSGEPAVLLLTGLALREKGLEFGARITAKTGARLLAQTFNRRMERGAGRISVERIPYPVEQALAMLAGVKHIVLVGSRVPVAFFAYPDKPSKLAPDDCQFVTLSRPEKVHARNSDGDEVESWLYPPLDPQPGKKYPLILYIHGGPQSFDGDYFDTDLENQVFAARGFAVLRVNYRGSTSYGEKFCRSLWADWHRREYDDLMVSVDEALKRPWIDGQRLGIGGWSYGGIMTVWTVAHTNRFRVGVPERFEIDYLSCFGEDQYFTQYLTELGSPFENADLYRKLSPGTYIPNIKTPLFLIADEKDGNCPPSQALQLYQRLKLLGIKTQLVIYPEETHTMSYPSHMVDRLNRLIGWYGQYLR